MENLENVVDFEDNSVELNTTEIQESTETSEQTTDFVETPADGEIAPAVEEGVEDSGEAQAEPEIAEEPAPEIPAEEDPAPIEAEPAIETESVGEDIAAQYAQLEAQYNQLSTDYAALQAENEQLLTFKRTIEDQQKDALIEKFYMLSDDEKADVINNKSNYTLEQIESKLSVIHFRKQESVEKVESASADAPVYTYTLDGGAGSMSVPAWVAALKNTQNNRNK